MENLEKEVIKTALKKCLKKVTSVFALLINV